MEPWQKAWREGFAPLLGTKALRALQAELQAGGPRLIQWSNLSPPPLYAFASDPVEYACPVAFLGWQGDASLTVEEVQTFFGSICGTVDASLGKLYACTDLTRWWDESQKEPAIAALLVEVNLTLAERPKAEMVP